MLPEALPPRIAAKIATNLGTGCWEWLAFLTKGYGQIWWDGRLQAAHRVVYELLVGPIPEGMTLDHLCRVRHCVNPTHCEPVTNRDNVLRGVGPSARAAVATKCVHGHAFDERNTYRHRVTGHRACRQCAADCATRRRARGAS